MKINRSFLRLGVLGIMPRDENVAKTQRRRELHSALRGSLCAEEEWRGRVKAYEAQLAWPPTAPKPASKPRSSPACLGRAAFRLREALSEGSRVHFSLILGETGPLGDEQEQGKERRGRHLRSPSAEPGRCLLHVVSP